MALFLKKQVDDDCLIGVWEIVEEIDVLKAELLKGDSINGLDIAEIERHKSLWRQKEWLCTRLLVNQLLGKPTRIKYDEFRKPHLIDGSYNLSITHSKRFVAVILSKSKRVGIDLEQVSDKIAKIAFKFLGVNELKNLCEKNKILQLYLHWCSKETLYKIYGRRDLDFVQNLKIETFDVNTRDYFIGFIEKDPYREEFLLHYFMIEDYVLVWSAK